MTLVIDSDTCWLLINEPEKQYYNLIALGNWIDFSTSFEAKSGIVGASDIDGDSFSVYIWKWRKEQTIYERGMWGEKLILHMLLKCIVAL